MSAATLTSSFGDRGRRSDTRLRLAGDRRQDGGVDLLHRHPRRDADGRLLNRIHLAVEDLDGRALPGEDRLERIVGEHDHEIGVTVIERPQRGVLVVDEALRVDELVELLARRVEHLLVDRSVLADEHGAQADRILGESGTEQQQQHERPGDQQGEQTRLAEDLGELLADERLRADEPAPRTVGPAELRRHDGRHRRRFLGCAGRRWGSVRLRRDVVLFVDAHDDAPTVSTPDDSEIDAR